MFIAGPPAGPPAGRDLHLIRAVRRTFSGPARFLADAANRARVGEYLTDMARPYRLELASDLSGAPSSEALGHSYGEMAETLIGPAVPAQEPVDLLVLAFSVHDLRPGRQTAAYLSHLTPGAPAAFAICDQGCAAAFSGLRIARAYASSAGIRRALLIVVEQAVLPYDAPVPLPAQHRGVAMLYGDATAIDGSATGPGGESAEPHDADAVRPARVAEVRQHPGAQPAAVAGLAAASLAEMAAGRADVRLVLSHAAAQVWTAPPAMQVRVMPPGQPCTGVWWGLIDELTGRAGLVVAADYDPRLRYLCLTAFDTSPR